MVSKNLPVDIKFAIPSKYGGYLEMREYLYTRFINWANTVVNPFRYWDDFHLGVKFLAWYMDPNGIGINVREDFWA